jgi:hypothetical protein
MVSEKFKEFRKSVEKQCSRTVKCLRFDGGGKYVGKVFKGYLSQNGILGKRFVPYTPPPKWNC